MQKRTLGNSGLEVSAPGLGTTGREAQPGTVLRSSSMLSAARPPED